MSSLIKFYNQFDEWGRLEREPIEFQVNWHYIKKYLPLEGNILDNGAGPGKYSIKLAQDGYNVTLTDLVPSLVSIAEEKAKEFGISHNFEGFHVANACDLSLFKDNQFDATLALGPMYHLQNELDRTLAIKEIGRVTKENGIVFVAFMPRSKHVLASLMNPENWKPNNNMVSLEQFIESGVFDHSDEGRFTNAFYFDVKDIKPFMEENGFKTLDLIGSSNLSTFLSQDQLAYWINKENSEASLLNLFIDYATDPNLLGMSSHLLYIGQKL